MNMKIIAGLGLMTAAVGVAGAAIKTADLQVSASIVSECNVEVSPLVFGDLSRANAVGTEVISNVSVQCTAGTPYDLRMGAGLHSEADAITARRMRNTDGLDYVRYEIYHPTIDTPWSDGRDYAGEPLETEATGGVDVYPVRAQILEIDPQAIGAYHDTVVVEIFY